MGWAALFGGLVAVVLTGQGFDGLLALGAGALAGFVFYWVESLIWPEVDCWAPWCKGGIVSWSPFTPRARRRHRGCGGSGKRRRTLAGDAS